MQTKDHSLLGRYLLTHCNLTADPLCQKMFLLGCIEPDWNLITYTRGSVRYQFLHGHNAENAKEHLARLTEKLLEGGVRTPLRPCQPDCVNILKTKSKIPSNAPKDIEFSTNKAPVRIWHRPFFNHIQCAKI